MNKNLIFNQVKYDEVIKIVSKLDTKDKKKLFQLLEKEIPAGKKNKKNINILDLAGSGKDLWNMDAQEYVNSIRQNRSF